MALNFGKPLSTTTEEDIPERSEILKERLEPAEKLFRTEAEEPREPEASEIPKENLDFTDTKRPFFKPRYEVLPSYDYSELLTGQAYMIYYLTTLYDSTATITYFLAPSAVQSATGTVNAGALGDTSGVKTKFLDLDFDITVGVPAILSKGTGMCAVSTTGKEAGGVVESYVIVKLRKYDGSTETEIANGKTATKGWTGSTTHWDDAVEFAITGDVRFNPGDILRVTVELWVSTTVNDAGNYVSFWADPTHDDHRSRAHLPFKIDAFIG